jgi:hypothetical protein
MEYTFFSVLENFSTIDHILGHKEMLKKYKKTEITPCILSDHNGIKLEIDNKRNYTKYSNTRRVNNSFFNNQLVIEEIREEIKKIPRSK